MYIPCKHFYHFTCLKPIPVDSESPVEVPRDTSEAGFSRSDAINGFQSRTQTINHPKGNEEAKTVKTLNESISELE